MTKWPIEIAADGAFTSSYLPVVVETEALERRKTKAGSVTANTMEHGTMGVWPYSVTRSIDVDP